MKIADVKSGSVTTHFQTITVEDGPVIQAGPQYYEDTKFQVEVVKRKRVGLQPWGDVTVIGHRVSDKPNMQNIQHQLVYNRERIPEWLSEILSAGMTHSILEGSAEEQALQA